MFGSFEEALKLVHTFGIFCNVRKCIHSRTSSWNEHWQLCILSVVYIITHICGAEFHFLLFGVYNGVLFHVGSCSICPQNLKYKDRHDGNHSNKNVVYKRCIKSLLLK